MNSGEKIFTHRALVATGAYTIASKLLPQKLDMRIRAAMIMVSEVGGNGKSAKSANDDWAHGRRHDQHTGMVIVAAQSIVAARFE